MELTHHEDRFDLQRFVEAQEPIFEQAQSELRAGKKQGHWMWFVFPQIKGLGSSPISVRYAISSRAEAEAYLEHPTLGPRLRECCMIVTLLDGLSIEQIFGYPDNLKFHSSITLFAHAISDDNEWDRDIFTDAVDKYFAGKWDQATLKILQDSL